MAKAFVMNPIVQIIKIFVVGCLLPSHFEEENHQAGKQVFVASSPCDNIVVRYFFSIPKDPDCEQIRWQISFDADQFIYEAMIHYGMSLPNTNNLRSGGKQVVKTGNYKVLRGLQGNPNAIVYQLESKDSKAKLRYLKLNDELIHLIGPGDQLAIGNGGWSYTLNNISKVIPSYTEINATTANVEVVDGVFEGRTPCREIAAQLKKETSPDCTKLKWRIFFDKKRMTYKTDGSFFRAQPRVGKFAVSQGIEGSSNAVVIQLDPDKPAESLFFLKGDDNILFFLNSDKKCFVGNGDFSFTLNRVRKSL